MNQVNTAMKAPHRPLVGRRWALLGAFLAILAPLLYVLQVCAKVLILPWYLPALTTLAVGFCLLGLLRGRSVWRWLCLVMSGLIAGFAWFLILVTHLPAYTGPIATGQSFPNFASQRADGTPFTQANFQVGQGTVLVFFRGHW